jgi:hypothetical protein
MVRDAEGHALANLGQPALDGGFGENRDHYRIHLRILTGKRYTPIGANYSSSASSPAQPPLHGWQARQERRSSTMVVLGLTIRAHSITSIFVTAKTLR